jgi:NAD(P)-dependent dehydrogenase (short-subunit alcohol dehydrogenase family)
MRSVIVTGGTGALGSEVVAAFLQAGDRVVVPWVIARERDEAAALHRQALAEQRLVLVEADLGQEAGAGEVVSLAGEPEVVVNLVGGFGGGTPLEETALEVWDRMYQVNVRTAASMSRAAIPALRRRGRGVLLFVAAQAALDCPPGLSAYNASKAALVALVKTLHKELSPAGIRVNAIVPTTIDTPANRKAMPKADFSAWTPPSQIARVLVFLTSDDARTVRGALVPV